MTRTVFWPAVVMGVLAGAPGAPAHAGDGPAGEAAALARVDEAFRGSAVVVAWSRLAYDVAFAEDQFLTFKGHRALAMMHLAMHDALNAVVPVYRRYAPGARDPMAHPVAAAAQAAHDVLASQYPEARPALEAELGRWLPPTADARPRRGIALGRRAAAAVLARRRGDRWDFAGSYTFRAEVGAYQTTPPWNGFVAQPGFRFARPFALDRPSELRPPAPPALASAAYAEAFAEVKDFGRADSAARTPDQTAYAVWWMEFAEASVNRLARELVTARQTHLWEAARLFALLNVALYDGYVAVWDAKYEHDHWRPYTAIREAGRDPSPATEPDPAWEPLRPTPPFPEYVSAHAAGCAGSFRVLARLLGDRGSFEMSTTTAPPGMPSRAFASFGAAAAECADSRVRLGWHFRYATDQGLALGRAVADRALARRLAPLDGQGPR
jgi:hypothetical protein